MLHNDSVLNISASRVVAGEKVQISMFLPGEYAQKAFETAEKAFDADHNFVSTIISPLQQFSMRLCLKSDSSLYVG
jgi:hypothetical protein